LDFNTIVVPAEGPRRFPFPEKMAQGIGRGNFAAGVASIGGVIRSRKGADMPECLERPVRKKLFAPDGYFGSRSKPGIEKSEAPRAGMPTIVEESFEEFRLPILHARSVFHRHVHCEPFVPFQPENQGIPGIGFGKRRLPASRRSLLQGSVQYHQRGNHGGDRVGIQ
jgi:hypothetical protein